jgi:glycosyltransferase involved in cell wall biosynthesis
VHDSLNKHDEKLVDEIAENFKTSNFVFVRGRFGSPGAARNAGKAKVKNKWLAFWDSDDQPKPHEFYDMVVTGESKGADAVVGGFVEVSSITGKDIRTIQSYSISDLAINPGLWRIAFRNEIIKSISFTSFLMGEDQIYLIECLDRINETIFVENIVYTYMSGYKNQLTNKKEIDKDLFLLFTYLSNTIQKSNRISNMIFFKITISLLIRAQNVIKVEVATKFLRLLIKNQRVNPTNFVVFGLYIIKNRIFN